MEEKFIYVTGGLYNWNPYHPGHGKKEFRLTQPYHTNDYRTFPYFRLTEKEARTLFYLTKHHAHLYRIKLVVGNREAELVEVSPEADNNGISRPITEYLNDKDYEGLALGLGKMGIDY